MGKKPLYFDLAEDLYVFDGLTLEQVAARLPEKVSITSLSSWKQDGEWYRLRSEWAQAQAELKRDSLQLKQKLIKKALNILNQDSPGPQELYAATSIANRVGRQESRGEIAEKIEADIDRPALFLEDLEFIVNILKEIDPEGLKVFARNFDVIAARGKAQYAQTA